MNSASPFRSAKRQRLILALLALAGVVAAGLIAARALREEAAYFRSPSEILAIQVAEEAPGGNSLIGKPLRLGAMVAVGSMQPLKDRAGLTFIAIDSAAQLSVEFVGVPPNLFAEGAGMIADGTMRADGVFVATRILAKHDENYRPPMMKDMKDMKDMKEGTVAKNNAWEKMNNGSSRRNGSPRYDSPSQPAYQSVPSS